MNEGMKNRLQQALSLREKKPVDLAKDLNIPKSAVSQYLSGKSKNMPSTRLYAIAKYLDVSEAWLMGFDVPMERPLEQKANDILVDIITRMRTDSDFFAAVKNMHDLDDEKFKIISDMLSKFS